MICDVGIMLEMKLDMRKSDTGNGKATGKDEKIKKYRKDKVTEIEG